MNKSTIRRSARWLLPTLLCSTGLTLAQLGFTPVTHRPRVLPAETADLSVRFRHLSPRVIMPGLLAHWPLDEGSGYVGYDTSGNGYAAYLTGARWNTHDSGLTAAFRRAGRRAGGMYLNGTQWLAVQHALAFSQPSFTIGLWVQVGRADSAGLVQAGDDRTGFRLGLSPAGAIRLTVADQTGLVHAVTSRPGLLQPGEWYYVTATADAPRGRLALYVNGQLTGEQVANPFTPMRLTQDVHIGRGLTGLLDEISWFDRALAADAIHRQYVLGVPKLYTQARATLDSGRTVWSGFGGNQPVPHPRDESVKLTLSFDGVLTDKEQFPQRPAQRTNDLIGPGWFGGALQTARLASALRYGTSLTGNQGTLEAYVQPTGATGGPLLQLTGSGGALTLSHQTDRWQVTLAGKQLVSGPAPAGHWQHLALTWDGGRGQLVLFVNGVAQDTAQTAQPLVFRQLSIAPGGAFRLDDLCLSDGVKDERTVFPHGQVDTESAALDLMHPFTQQTGESVHGWRGPAASWQYAAKPWEDDGTHTGDGGLGRQALWQPKSTGLRWQTHPRAWGFDQSVEAGVAVPDSRDGWAGVFVQATNGGGLSGRTFSYNPARNRLRLATYRDGKVTRERTVTCPFRLQPRRTYTLTLTAANGTLRGYVDGHNLLSDTLSSRQAVPTQTGLFTDQTAAYFDDVHFTALTPARANSRQLQFRVWADPAGRADVGVGYENLAASAFRWQKRYGLLPWQRTTKNPEPPGNLFGPTDSTARPNASRPWRSEDAANSDLLLWNGTVLYLMRGNPDHNGPHGLAQLGVLTTPADRFDGVHFTDVPDSAALLRGHAEANPACADAPPRDRRYQVNDEGAAVANGKVVVMAREFRNRVGRNPWYHRLVYGLLDPETGHWQTPEPFYVPWSTMDPADCQARHAGLDATPELVSLREPVTDEDVLFLFHHRPTAPGPPTNGIVGLRLDGDSLRLHPAYPARDAVTKLSGDRLYGERILFDNGIYYLHVNAGSDPGKLARDWPDRFELFSSLHPYAGPWVSSRANTDSSRVYFGRGGSNDPDNGAIWQGTLVKQRGRYYLYYENFHVVDNVNQPYEHYDYRESGSRVGFATAN